MTRKKAKSRLMKFIRRYFREKLSIKVNLPESRIILSYLLGDPCARIYDLDSRIYDILTDYYDSHDYIIKSKTAVFLSYYVRKYMSEHCM